MSKRIGKRGKVTVGASTVVGIGTWSINGIQADQIDASALGDEWKQYEFGMKDGGDVSFNGHFDPDDSTGQAKVYEANLYNSHLEDLRFYIDSTSYFEPCQTTGYFSPTLTTGAPTCKSSVTITSYQIQKDKGGLDSVSFSGKVSGVMVLV